MAKQDVGAGNFIVPAAESRIEHLVENSRFIASIGPAADIDSAKLFIKRIRDEFADASHNVPAYIIGGGNSTTDYCSDDHEPSGTAGRPALAVLKGSGMADVVLVVTRYFGGTKLGTGGLVRAYTESAKLAVYAVPRARRVSVSDLSVSLQYNQLEKVRALVKANGGEIRSEDFTEIVAMTVSIPTDKCGALQAALMDYSAGKIKTVLSTTTDRFVPFKR